MKVLIIDNYDSFTFNLYQYVGEILTKKHEAFVLDVFKNNEIDLGEIKKRNYDRIIISPGPGDPRKKEDFGVCSEVIVGLGKSTPIFGVCLGMQGIAFCFGANVVRAKEPMHGKTSVVTHDGRGVFKDIPQDTKVMRYHSLIVEKENLPECLEITATAKDSEEIMGLRHRTFPIVGVQFHPESFATEEGKNILRNFLFQV